MRHCVLISKCSSRVRGEFTIYIHTRHERKGLCLEDLSNPNVPVQEVKKRCSSSLLAALWLACKHFHSQTLKCKTWPRKLGQRIGEKSGRRVAAAQQTRAILCSMIYFSGQWERKQTNRASKYGSLCHRESVVTLRPGVSDSPEPLLDANSMRSGNVILPCLGGKRVPLSDTQHGLALRDYKLRLGTLIWFVSSRGRRVGASRGIK